MNRNAFEWTLGLPPPRLQSHSAAKHRLIKNYLERYFNTVTVVGMDQLQISLIDGFCGGGVFENSEGEKVPGTPMIMLQSVKDAEAQINQKLQKKITINAKYYFIDKSESAINYLKNEIQDTEFAHQVIDTSIHLRNGKFEEEYEKIIKDILSRAPAGRSIFLLDQCGYGQVPLLICRNILRLLPKSEIILTFAIDWLVDHASLKQEFLKSVQSLGLLEAQIKKFLETKDNRNYRYLTQRFLAKHLQHETGVPFFTPFFLHSEEAHRNLWVIHLSKHPTARNVMVSCHWEIQNSSIHQGEAGLNMLGFGPNWENQPPLDFMFDKNAENLTMEALRKDIPYRIEKLSGRRAISIDDFLYKTVNDTPARYDQIVDALQYLHGEKDIEIWTPSSREKKPNAQLKGKDRIRRHIRQSLLPIFKKQK